MGLFGERRRSQRPLSDAERFERSFRERVAQQRTAAVQAPGVRLVVPPSEVVAAGSGGSLPLPVPSRRPEAVSPRTGLTQAEVDRYVDERIEEILTVHYRQVLESKEGRAMWRKLLKEASAAEVVRNIGKA